MIKSAYTREDYDRFDENGKYIPYEPTEEELAKKDEIRKVLEQELSDAYELDPMDDYAGYDSTDARIDMACERVAKQFGVDTDFVEEIAGEIQYEEYTGLMPEDEWIYKHYDDKHKFWDWQNSELDVKPLMLKNSNRKLVKSDAASEQKLKEDLIRQGYTEDEANQIVEQRKPQDVQSGKKVVESDA